MRRAFTLLSALAASSCVTPPRSVPPTESVPPIVVAFVVDQLSAWVAEERIPRLPADGFFARMRREGTWAQHMRYSYALTDTAPGHAALHTGKAPYESGIFVNHNPDEKTGIRRSYFRDPATRMVLPDGVKDEPGSSAKSLAAQTVADRLAERSRAKVLSFSLKDRAALLPAGRRPTHALWFEPARGAFATSTAIAPAFPAWAVPIGSAAAVAKAWSEEWTLLDRDWVEENAETKDDAPGEGDLQGLGTTFPHRASNPWAFRATPMADRVLLDLALAGAKAEWDRGAPLLLLVSLSSSDVIGHTFGPSSWEAWDHLRRLDRSLADFLQKLEELVEGRPVGVLLSGDHGNVTMPEARLGCEEGRASDPYDRPCAGGGRLQPDELRTELRAELGDAIAGLSDGYVFLTAAARAEGEPRRAAIDAGVRRILREKHGRDIAEVFDVRDLAKRCPGVLGSQRGIPARALPGEDVLVHVCRSWAPGGGAGDYYVLPAHGSFFDGEVVPGKGTSHGTPYLYDRTVPLFVRGRGVDAGKVIADPLDFTAYSALEASFLRLDPRTPVTILKELTARP